MVRALVVIAEGSEEMEATIVIDLLRRASIDVTVAGLDGRAPVKCSRGVVITPDVAFSDAPDDFDALILPGGRGGADRFADSAAVGAWLKRFESSSRVVGAICAAPIALVRHGVFGGRRMTCHPSVDKVVDEHGTHLPDNVVTDGTLVTSRGPGTAFLFALELIEVLVDTRTADTVRAPLMLA